MDVLLSGVAVAALIVGVFSTVISLMNSRHVAKPKHWRDLQLALFTSFACFCLLLGGCGSSADTAEPSSSYTPIVAEESAASDLSESSVEEAEIEAEEVTYSLDEISNLADSTYIEQSGVCTEIVEYFTASPTLWDSAPWLVASGVTRHATSVSDDYDVLSLPEDDDPSNLYGSYFVWLLNNDETGDAYEFKQIPSDGRIVTTIYCEEVIARQVLATDLWCAPSGTALEEYDEVNGVDITSDDEIAALQGALSGTGIEMMVDENRGAIAYVSYYPASVICGYYDGVGTDFIEEEIAVDIPCFITFSSYTAWTTEGWNAGGWDVVSLSVEKTKDGYFIIDTSSLDSGKYILVVDSVYYLIEK